jgi:hypothetical protein
MSGLDLSIGNALAAAPSRPTATSSPAASRAPDGVADVCLTVRGESGARCPTGEISHRNADAQNDRDHQGGDGAAGRADTGSAARFRCRRDLRFRAAARRHDLS